MPVVAANSDAELAGTVVSGALADEAVVLDTELAGSWFVPVPGKERSIRTGIMMGSLLSEPLILVISCASRFMDLRPSAQSQRAKERKKLWRGLRISRQAIGSSMAQ